MFLITWGHQIIIKETARIDLNTSERVLLCNDTPIKILDFNWIIYNQQNNQ